jgi:hypothetical protein
MIVREAKMSFLMSPLVLTFPWSYRLDDIDGDDGEQMDAPPARREMLYVQTEACRFRKSHIGMLD